MGATNFATAADGATVSEAFQTARTEAQYEYGHGGYTGTIAEKGSYRVFQLPAGLEAREAAMMLVNYGWDEFTDANIRAVWPSIAEAARTFDDKWGPAVALQAGPTSWVFCGMASE
jgi:hypothetical protein